MLFYANIIFNQIFFLQENSKLVGQVTLLTDEKVDLKTQVEQRETDLQHLRDEIDHFEVLLNKADNDIMVKDQTIINLQQQLNKESSLPLKNGPLVAAVMAALRENETTQAKVCTECEASKEELSKFMEKAKELQRIVDNNKLQLDFFRERNAELDECLMAAEKEVDETKKETYNMECLYEKVANERNLYERRFLEVLEEQDVLDSQIRKLVKDKNQLVDHYEDELISMKEEMKRIMRARGIQKSHDETIQIGLQHLQSCLQKKLSFLGVFKCHKTASKLDIVNKLLVHADCALSLAR